MNEPTSVLQAVDVSKNYPGVQALKGVNLTLRAGEVTALMGENGAGKSTLIRIIGGLEKPTAGHLELRGAQIDLSNAAESQRAGISVVSQEFRLVPQLTVAENIFLGREITRNGLIRPNATRQRARKLLDELELDLDPGRTVETLSVGDQQMVEITRALSNDFEILVMDEPSAALNGDEVTRLLDLVRRLRKRGKAILYVSHRLAEIFAISDRISVFRDGVSVGDLATADTTEPQLVELMLGRELQAFEAKQAASLDGAAAPTRAGIEVKGLRCARIPEPVTISVAAGEIVGLAGLVGSGRTELVQAMFGMIPSHGEVYVASQPVKLRSPADAISSGIFMLSENRKSEGILPHLSVLENLVISSAGSDQSRIKRQIPSRTKDLSTYQRLKGELKIRVDRPQQFIGNLSGGNQQKVLFGRAILSGCSVLLLNEPTRGVDVGAKVEIYQLVQKVAASGVAVIVSSSDAPELVTLVSRCLVMRAGRIEAELTGADITDDQILAQSVGTRARLNTP